MKNDKTWYDETKEYFIKNIKNTYTLNLAISILEDRKSLLNENLNLKEAINKATDKLYCYGEALKPEFQNEMLEILGADEYRT